MKSFAAQVRIIVGVVCLLFLRVGAATGMPAPEVVRGPILSEGWYPQEKDALDALLDRYFALAEKDFGVVVGPDSIRAIIVPHAGYAYSGLCAATAFRPLLESGGKKNTHIKRVIVLAPSHQLPFDFVALPDFTSYRTALGDISIDREVVAKLALSAQFRVFGDVYLTEHSMEIELPFLQKTVAQFKLVPLIVGSLNKKMIEKVAHTLRTIIDDHTLVVVSSDFVHHGKSYGYEKFAKDIVDQVRQLDSELVQAIVTQSPDRFADVMQRTHATVCGHDPISILLDLIHTSALGELESRLTCYYCSPQIERARTRDGGVRTSGLFDELSDAAAKTGVSYVGLLFTTQKRAKLAVADRLTGYEKHALLALARRGIANVSAPALLYPIASEGMSVPAGAFVTLKLKNGDLRGCIGTIETKDPLYRTVLGRARDSAFHDSRFSPLTEAELNDVVIDITILEPPVDVSGWKDIVVGKHGVILKQGFASAVFLPQVAPEQGWDRETMLSHLARKAGLPADAWKDSKTTFRVFEGGEISE